MYQVLPSSLSCISITSVRLHTVQAENIKTIKLPKKILSNISTSSKTANTWNDRVINTWNDIVINIDKTIQSLYNGLLSYTNVVFHTHDLRI